MKNLMLKIGIVSASMLVLFSCSSPEEDAKLVVKNVTNILVQASENDDVSDLYDMQSRMEEKLTGYMKSYEEKYKGNTENFSLFQKNVESGIIDSQDHFSSVLKSAIIRQTSENQKKITGNGWYYHDEDNDTYTTYSFTDDKMITDRNKGVSYNIDCDTISFTDGTSYELSFGDGELNLKDRSGNNDKNLRDISYMIRERLTFHKWWQKANPAKDANLYSFKSGYLKIINSDSQFEYSLSNDTINISNLETAVVSFSGNKMFLKDAKTGKMGTFIPATEKSMFWGEWHWKMMALVHNYVTFYSNGKQSLKSTAAMGRIVTFTWDIKNGKLRYGNKAQPYRPYRFASDDRMIVEDKDGDEVYERMKTLHFKSANIRLLFQ